MRIIDHKDLESKTVRDIIWEAIDFTGAVVSPPLKDSLLAVFESHLRGFSKQQIIMGLGRFMFKHGEMPLPDELLIAIRSRSHDEYMQTETRLRPWEKTGDFAALELAQRSTN